MILVDSSHEDQQRRFAEIDPSRAGPPPATKYEAFDMEATSRALARDRWRAPIPLVVLTRSFTAAPGAGRADYDVWLEMQRELASRSPLGEHVVAAHSGHYIQNDEPALVVDAVRRVLAAVKP